MSTNTAEYARCSSTTLRSAIESFSGAQTKTLDAQKQIGLQMGELNLTMQKANQLREKKNDIADKKNQIALMNIKLSYLKHFGNLDNFSDLT